MPIYACDSNTGPVVVLDGSSETEPGAGPMLPYPILFVTQPPVAADFTTIGSTFGNHLGGIKEAVRGAAGQGTVCVP